MDLWVLLFNARTDNEGIYTLAIQGKNTVLAFQEEDDALRYAMLLEAQDFMSATVEAIAEEELKEFCQGADLELNVIEPGMLAIPPEENVEKLDWSPEAAEPAPSELDLFRKRLENLL
jgi:hypothetical protein